jgi:predicted phage tail protein
MPPANARRTQDIRRAVNSAHDRIDALAPTVTQLAEQMQAAARSIDRMAASVQETATQVNVHVAECKLLRAELQQSRQDEKGKWDWAMQGAVIGLLVIVWEGAKHYLGWG